ncbi:MAG TPA: transposase [Mycobacterium sp.]|nr:transposase [Mycobacterium sp.]
MCRLITDQRRTTHRQRSWPTAAIVDPSSVTASPVTGPRGFGGHKVDGIKRHALVNTAGVLVAAVLTPADLQGRAAFTTLLRQAKPIAPTISHVWVDNGYTGQAHRRHRGRCHRRRGVRAKARLRLHRPPPPLAGRTHQRLDQPPSPHRPTTTK